MTIDTRFGKFTNIDHIEPYGGDGCYALGYMEDYYDADVDRYSTGNETPYALLGFDVPVIDDPKWRFWVEFGDRDGYAETYDAELSQSDMDKIIGLYEREKGVIVTDYYIEE